MKNIIPIISGKGGVGKSTVSVNLAVALAQTGARVALVDCDFYGPSIPTLMGGGQIQTNHEEKIIPPVKFGVKYISLGFFLKNQDDAVIWRGPMFTKAMQQLFQDVSWGEVDYCIVDMPPGTGDAQLSLCQMLTLSGAVVVTTPQEVALADVRKAISMLNKVNVPVLGIVENMSWLVQNGEKLPIFGNGGGAALASKMGVPLLAQLPLDIAVREGGDKGIPSASQHDSEASKIFTSLALQLMDILDKRNSQASPVRIINS